MYRNRLNNLIQMLSKNNDKNSYISKNGYFFFVYQIMICDDTQYIGMFLFEPSILRPCKIDYNVYVHLIYLYFCWFHLIELKDILHTQ